MLTEITAQKVSRAAPEETDVFKQTSLDSIEDEIIVLDGDGDGVVVAVNQSWLQYGLDNVAPEETPTQGIGIGSSYLRVSEAAERAGPEEVREDASRALGLITEFLADYRRSPQNFALGISSALSVGDRRSAANGPHKLKSSSRALGALVLDEVCARLEEVRHCADAAATRPLEAEFELAMSALLSPIQQRGVVHGLA